jgi:hypothetical protein
MIANSFPSLCGTRPQPQPQRTVLFAASYEETGAAGNPTKRLVPVAPRIRPTPLESNRQDNSCTHKGDAALVSSAACVSVAVNPRVASDGPAPRKRLGGGPCALRGALLHNLCQRRGELASGENKIIHNGERIH